MSCAKLQVSKVKEFYQIYNKDKLLTDFMRNKTIRKELISLLEEKEMTARDLSKALKIQEKEVYDHLEHVRRSLKAQKKKLNIDPYYCLVCDFVFKDRRRLSRPGRCPKCRQGHIEPAAYRIF